MGLVRLHRHRFAELDIREPVAAAGRGLLGEQVTTIRRIISRLSCAQAVGGHGRLRSPEVCEGRWLYLRERGRGVRREIV
jgi:hypothetical protein